MTQNKHNINERPLIYKKTKQLQAKQDQQEQGRLKRQINIHVQGKTVKEALDNLSSMEDLPDHAEDLLKTNRLDQQKNKSPSP